MIVIFPSHCKIDDAVKYNDYISDKYSDFSFNLLPLIKQRKALNEMVQYLEEGKERGVKEHFVDDNGRQWFVNAVGENKIVYATQILKAKNINLGDPFKRLLDCEMYAKELLHIKLYLLNMVSQNNIKDLICLFEEKRIVYLLEELLINLFTRLNNIPKKREHHKEEIEKLKKVIIDKIKSHIMRILVWDKIDDNPYPSYLDEADVEPIIEKLNSYKVKVI